MEHASLPFLRHLLLACEDSFVHLVRAPVTSLSRVAPGSADFSPCPNTVRIRTLQNKSPFPMMFPKTTHFLSACVKKGETRRPYRGHANRLCVSACLRVMAVYLRVLAYLFSDWCYTRMPPRCWCAFFTLSMTSHLVVDEVEEEDTAAGVPSQWETKQSSR